MEQNQHYQAYRDSIRPYLRYMVTLSQLFQTCGIQVTPPGTMIITAPQWMNRKASCDYHHAARTIAHLRHAATSSGPLAAQD